jgi:hypothetical protein
MYDNFMRAFVLEVSFMRNIQFDITKILQNVNEVKEQNKEMMYENLKEKMKEKGGKSSLWGTYKRWIAGEPDIDITDHFIQQRIKDKWKRVC